MNPLPEFRPGGSADEAHRALVRSLKILDEAQNCSVLWFGEIMRRGLFRDLGYSSMRQYALEGLGFSRTRAGDFLRLATRLESLPTVRAEVASGRLGYTKARQIVGVADEKNEKAWVAAAKGQSRRELAVTVSRAKKAAARVRSANPDQGQLMPAPVPELEAAVPVRVTFELDPQQAARYQAILGKLGHRGSKSELLLEMAAALMDAESAPRGAPAPPVQIHVHECPTCKRATVQTPQGEKELTPVQAEAARCDARIQEPGKRNKATIPPGVRSQVLARDRHQCRRKGCGNKRFLHLHHIVPRANGGTNEASHLVTLCSACHHLWHEKGGNLQEMLTPDPG